MSTKDTVFETEYMGMPFKGTMEQFRQWLVAVRTNKPSQIDGDGSSNGYTEKERELWKKGRIFGLAYAKVVADNKFYGAVRGHENLDELEKGEQKAYLQADTQLKIKKLCEEENLDYKEYKEAWEYKKAQEEKKKEK